MIQILNKKIGKSDIKGNFVFAHEHLNFDLRHIRNDNQSCVKDNNLVSKELENALMQGLGLVVDLSNQSMNSDKIQLLELQQKLNLPIVAATGYYLNEYETKNTMTVNDIEKQFLKHLTVGFGNDIKAGIIGEIATSSDKIHSFEQKVFEAAVNVQKKTGAPIYSHLNLGDFALEQKQMLKKYGAIPEKIIIGHVEFIKDINKIKNILNDGFNIGIDTIGKQNYLSDKVRANMLVELIQEGWEDKIVISLDISKQDYLTSQGGHGYSHLINKFYPLIKDKITDIQWKKISFNNILNILDWS